MIKSIQHLIDNPEDLPDIPRSLKDYLEARYNASYLYLQAIPEMRRQGCSEEFISGVLYGFHKAQEVLDEIEQRKRNLQEG